MRDSLYSVSPSKAAAGSLTSDQPRSVITLGVRSATDWPVINASVSVEFIGRFSWPRLCA